MVVPALWSCIWCCAKMVSNGKWTLTSRIFTTTNHDRHAWRVSRSDVQLFHPCVGHHRRTYLTRFSGNPGAKRAERTSKGAVATIGVPREPRGGRCASYVACYMAPFMCNADQWDPFMNVRVWVYVSVHSMFIILPTPQENEWAKNSHSPSSFFLIASTN